MQSRYNELLLDEVTVYQKLHVGGQPGGRFRTAAGSVCTTPLDECVSQPDTG
jgi:hypothetical protein